MRTDKKYLTIHTSYHGCYTRGCLFGRPWRRVGDVYANDHRIRVERSLVSKFMIDSTKLEVDLQSNVRKVRNCFRLEFFLSNRMHTVLMPQSMSPIFLINLYLLGSLSGKTTTRRRSPWLLQS